MLYLLVEMYTFELMGPSSWKCTALSYNYADLNDICCTVQDRNTYAFHSVGSTLRQEQ